VPAPIFAIWYAGIAIKAFAVYRIAKKGLFTRLPLLWAYIAVSVARSIVLAAVRADAKRYADISADTLPMMLLSETFAVVSIFWLLTENFPRWRKPGTISLLTMGAMGAVVALVSRRWGVPDSWTYGWAGAWEMASLLQRHALTVMGLVLVGTRVLLAIARMIPVSPLARRAADALGIDVLLGLAGIAVTMTAGKQYPLAAYAWPTLSGVVNGLLWAFWLPAASDVREPATRWVRGARIDWRAGVSDLLGRLGLEFVVKPR
jgi:hypothetical protein